MIDTGSSITAISHDTWLKISNPDIKLNTSVFSPIQSASGNFLCIYGSFNCHFEIDGSFYPFQTYVIHDLSHPVILGHDFLSALALSLNFLNSSLHLRSSPLTPLPSRPSLHQSKCFTVTVDESFLVLPPRAETVFSAKISPNVSPSTVGLVNPEVQLSDKHFLSRAYLLATVSHDHTVPVRILNPHPHAILLYPRTKLVTFDCSNDILAGEPIPLFDTAHSLAPNTIVTDLPTDFSDPVLNDSEEEQLLSLLQNYSDIFSTHSYDLSRTSLIDHHIDVQNSVPIRQ